jgi:tetratricopeptide (TPR) repeat protein
VNAKDRQHIEAAEGWLDLGDWQSANDELEQLQPQSRAEPEVLALRYDVYCRANKWVWALEVAQAFTELRPDCDLGWIYAADALHALKRNEEARALLLIAVAKFPGTCRIHYNLACCSVQLGRLDEAYTHIERAINLDPKAKTMALEDNDLDPILAQIAGI